MDKTNVLLIDDNDHQIELFRCYASTSNNISLSATTNLLEAIYLINSEKPDIVFLDNRLLPYETFEETAPILRALGYKGKIVVISADISRITSSDLETYCISGCLDKFDFDLYNFDDRVQQLLAA